MGGEVSILPIEEKQVKLDTLFREDVSIQPIEEKHVK